MVLPTHPSPPHPACRESMPSVATLRPGETSTPLA
jgi:hypothetical protein